MALACGIDGSLYVGDFNYVRRVRPSGNVTSVLELRYVMSLPSSGFDQSWTCLCLKTVDSNVLIHLLKHTFPVFTVLLRKQLSSWLKVRRAQHVYIVP